MHTRGGLNHAAHLAGLESKRSVFELLLHLPFPEEAQITPLPSAAAVRLRNG